MNDNVNRLSIVLFVGDILLTPLGLLLATIFRATLPFGLALDPGAEALPIPIYLFAVICWSGALTTSGSYSLKQTLRPISSLTRLITASGIATILLAGILYFTFREVSRLQFLYFFFINILLLSLFRLSIYLILRTQSDSALLRTRKVLMIGSGDLAQEIARQTQENPIWGYSVAGYLDDEARKKGEVYERIPVIGNLDDLVHTIDDLSISEVWSTLPPRSYDKLHQMVSKLGKIPVRIKVIPDYFSLALVQAKVEMLGGFPIIGLREPIISGFPRILKRLFDITLSTVTLLLTAPVMTFIAILIRLDSKGPVLFRQTRVGENGRLFQMLKFRTMVFDADEKLKELEGSADEGEFIHKRKGDPRVTRVGRALRRLSLDELPQLINVLRGEMSVVGPRPELPWLVEKYKPWQRKRFAVPQGITGWWQINGRGDKPMHLNTDEDLYYIYNYSLLLDIIILLRTPLAVLQGRGAF